MIGFIGSDGAGHQPASTRWVSTGHSSPSVKACLRYGRSVNSLRTGAPARLQLPPSGVEVEAALQVVHAGRQQRLAVQQAPQADRSELGAGL